MKRGAGLVFAVAVATSAYDGLAWSHSTTTAPGRAWIDWASDHSDATRFALGRRLSEVAYRIGVSNTELCAGDRARLLGLVSTASDYSAFGYDRESEPLSVLWVVPGGPAAESGLREGDRLLDIDGEPLPFHPAALDQLAYRFTEDGHDVVSLGIERAGSRSRVAVSPKPACDYQVELSPSEDVNAFTQLRHVVITAGLMILLPHDDQLAGVVGHELGHIVAGHTLGAMDPGMATEAEAEADYLGVYLAARAGYDISGAKDVLQRIVAARHGGSVDDSSTADIAGRLRAIRAATGEIALKRVLGQNLDPSPDQLLHHTWN
ncbi:MAG TPA: M48 family metalloprotease [Candidatus Acidoferrum sp.]|nr:M48 family metalloprotease [Candidatus Acidoferrum sp.]